MRAALLAVLVFLGSHSFLATPAAFAQQMQQEPSAQDIVGVMKQALNLSDSQVRQIVPVIKEHLRQIKMLKAEATDASSIKNRMEYLRKDLDDSLEDYLTEDQIKIWRAQGEKSQVEASSPRGKRYVEPPAAERGSGKFSTGGKEADGVLESTGAARSKSGVF